MAGHHPHHRRDRRRPAQCAHSDPRAASNWRAARPVGLGRASAGPELADALRDPAHPLSAAAVDTFAHEHATFASPLLGLPNALLTPHVAGMTRSAMATAALRCADHIAALLADHPDGVPVVTL
ncbi:NAD(P)-dependent oxidoreductase [Streptomyces sp. SID14478]|uniref:NAD(P)-dependent oxidoreductase n=1 Tax=Streptomyces sp. SID14478 TaxID=2706073 RepID=UPI001EF18B9C|nr:NAD(P)-dependent oxidoreductase [Streptomyces sp. SID14478]